MARGKINYFIKPDDKLGAIVGTETKSATEIMKDFFGYIKANKLGYKKNESGELVQITAKK